MKRVLFALLTFFVFIVLPHDVFAARLSISPATATISQGQTVSVSVILSSTDQASNAVSGSLTFPTNKLQIISVSKAGSILSLWVSEPTYSNSTGKASFEGIIPNPGYSGSRGTVITYTFRAIASGPAAVSFSQASVLANDGQGTNILSDFTGANFTVSGESETEEVKPVVAPKKSDGTPEAPVISSGSHPSPSKWYKETTAKFTWDVPEGVTSIRLSLDKESTKAPTETDSASTKSASFDDIDEGTWYFHLQFRNEKGWGSVGSYRVRVDTTPPTTPDFTLVDADHEKRSPTITIRSSDDLSGIAYYRVKFGDNPYETFAVSDDTGEMVIPARKPGEQTVIVEAYDHAGNKSISAKELNIQTIDAPQITEVPKILDKGQGLVVRGNTYPETEVRVFMKDKTGKEIFESTRSGAAGDFTLIWKGPLTDGEYELTAQAVNSYGVESPRSDSKDVSVHPSILFRVGSWVVTVASFATFAVIVLLGLMYGGLILWKRFTLFRRRLNHEMDLIDRSVHTAFNLLKDEIRHEVRSLQKVKSKRKLTQEEERIIDRFSADVDDAERFIEKQIRDMKKGTE